MCQSCGRAAAKPLGRCPACGEWNTYVEEVVESAPAKRRSANGASSAAPRPLSHIEAGPETDRLPLSIGEFARVLGGGIVPGSLVLVGGDPGIGKSTLLL
ncbi:MAG: DNA repair protein RadA, partial [Anaerolineales bacterium]